jgi:hypothetical protein
LSKRFFKRFFSFSLLLKVCCDFAINYINVFL